MNDKEIHSILQEAVEEEIPSGQINLWTAVKADLVAGKQNAFQQGDNMNTINTRQARHWPRAALALMVVAVLLALAAVTPQGRTFAQNFWQFFNRAESDTMPLPATQVITQSDPAVATAVPPAPLVSIIEASAQAGFPVAALPATQTDFVLQGARVYGGAVHVEYEARGGDGYLIISQSRDGYLQSDWDQAPAEAATPVQIGELPGEFVAGTFVVYAGDSSATWNADAPILRLRWVQDGVWMQMQRYEDNRSSNDSAGLVALAESLVIGDR
ncbi:MAG TPA: hypothetical protein PLD25_23385 [Chloroflexota bacterium]|nr:hypothetical protein [Chloroflexota bacterium]